MTSSALTPTRQQAIEEVRRIVLDTVAGTPARVYLFGSCATGHVHRFSDIDVAIDPVEPLPPGLLLDIAEALEESSVPYFVDVVDLSQAGPELRARVMREGIRWTG